MASLCKTAPATPYSIIAELGLVSEGRQQMWGGMAWRNTTNGKAESMALWADSANLNSNNNCGSGNCPSLGIWSVVGFEGYALANTQGWNDNLYNMIAGSQVIWMKLKNDGTNMYEYFSFDGV